MLKQFLEADGLTGQPCILYSDSSICAHRYRNDTLHCFIVFVNKNKTAIFFNIVLRYSNAGTDGGGGFNYKLPGKTGRIGQFGDFIHGLPSAINAYLFFALAGLLAVLVLWPVPVGLWYRLRFGSWPKRRVRKDVIRRFVRNFSADQGDSNPQLSGRQCFLAFL